MQLGRRYCQLCRRRPVADGGNESCPVLKVGARKSFESMWRAGLGEKPGHECGAYQAPPKSERKPPAEQDGLF